MAASASWVSRVVLAGLCLGIGIGLAYIGSARPEFVFTAAKTQGMIRVFGAGGMAAVFLGLAAVNVLAALVILFKRNPGSESRRAP